MAHAPASSLSLSRRRLLQFSAAAGLTSLFKTSAYAEAPKRGGRMILGSMHGSTTDSTDPALLTNAFQWYLAFAFTSTLTEILPDGTIGPALAERWDSTDAKVWKFKLRDGVTFHDGRPMSVADVIASINHHRAPDSTSFVKPLADQMVDVSGDGKNGVVISLKAANADLPANLNTPAFTIYPAAGEKIDWQSRNGTGGYILREYEPGVRAYLERNPRYWRNDRAFADEVEMLCIGDATARMNALVSGEVHAVDEVDLKTVALLQKQPNITIDETPGPLQYSFPMRTDVAPFDNVDVRLALKYSINRQEMLDKILLGHGSLGNDTPIGPSYTFHANIEQIAYDPDKAKFHLKKAGLQKLSVDLHTAEAAFPGATDAAVLYAEQARASGIEINVVREPDDGYWDNIWLKKPFCAAYWDGFPMTSEMFAVGYSPGAAWNDTYWTNQRFEYLRVAAAAEMDANKRRDMYTEMQKIVRDDGGALIFAYASYVMARGPSIGHGPLSTTNRFDGARIAERWWLV
ncbi:ABC transporter substrate-binding protein [Mesorhizobium shangrilense]|uniref:ABC transporter substrate-binding protein n=1 Tax=Mesorhizobium shangrilense TaxID=460060 RepID=A0ABV2DQ41_9HYPH